MVSKCKHLIIVLLTLFFRNLYLLFLSVIRFIKKENNLMKAVNYKKYFAFFCFVFLLISCKKEEMDTPQYFNEKQIKYTDFKENVNKSNLIPGRNYIVINGPANKSFLVTAVSSSSVNHRIVLIENDDFGYYELDLQNDKILAFDVLTCICRDVADTWRFIEDERHRKRKVRSLTQPSQDVLRVVYDKDYTKVVSSSVVVDETYVVNAISCGASVDLAFMDIWFFNSTENRRLSHSELGISWANIWCYNIMVKEFL